MSEKEELCRLLERLKMEHRQLDDKIDGLSQETVVDNIALQRLKKQKLALKDRISCIENEILPDIIA